MVDEVLDSLGIVEAAVFIEEEISRWLEASEDVRATFPSVGGGVDFVISKH